jgi:predicted RNase H-like nuclease
LIVSGSSNGTLCRVVVAVGVDACKTGWIAVAVDDTPTPLRPPRD